MFKKYFLQISLLVTAIPVFASQPAQSGAAASSGVTPSDDATTTMADLKKAKKKYHDATKVKNPSELKDATDAYTAELKKMVQDPNTSTEEKQARFDSLNAGKIPGPAVCLVAFLNVYDTEDEAEKDPNSPRKQAAFREAIVDLETNLKEHLDDPGISEEIHKQMLKTLEEIQQLADSSQKK